MLGIGLFAEMNLLYYFNLYWKRETIIRRILDI